MFALTIDQRRSRRGADAVPALLDELATLEVVRRFERTAGDEVQGLVERAGVVVDIVTRIAGRDTWWVGLGIGEVESPLPTSVRASRGPALVAARAAVERAPRASAGLAVEPAAQDAETVLQALAHLVGGRSAEGHEAVAAMRVAATQAQAAERLGISAQAMSARLRVARWKDEERLGDLAARLLAGPSVPPIS